MHLPFLTSALALPGREQPSRDASTRVPADPTGWLADRESSATNPLVFNAPRPLRSLKTVGTMSSCQQRTMMSATGRISHWGERGSHDAVRFRIRKGTNVSGCRLGCFETMAARVCRIDVQLWIRGARGFHQQQVSRQDRRPMQAQGSRVNGRCRRPQGACDGIPTDIRRRAWLFGKGAGPGELPFHRVGVESIHRSRILPGMIAIRCRVISVGSSLG